MEKTRERRAQGTTPCPRGSEPPWYNLNRRRHGRRTKDEGVGP